MTTTIDKIQISEAVTDKPTPKVLWKPRAKPSITRERSSFKNRETSPKRQENKGSKVNFFPILNIGRIQKFICENYKPNRKGIFYYERQKKNFFAKKKSETKMNEFSKGKAK